MSVMSDSGRYPDECEGCGVEGPGPIGSGVGGEPLRAIKMKAGGREMLCVECFVEAVEEGRVDESDPRVEPDRLITGTPGAPGQDADPDGWIHRPNGGTADNESTGREHE